MKNDKAPICQVLRLGFIIHHSAFILRSGIRGEITIMLRFERRVCRWESCRMHQFSWRVSPMQRRPAQNGKVEGASPSRATNFNLLP